MQKQEKGTITQNHILEQGNLPFATFDGAVKEEVSRSSRLTSILAFQSRHGGRGVFPLFALTWYAGRCEKLGLLI